MVQNFMAWTVQEAVVVAEAVVAVDVVEVAEADAEVAANYKM